jgi:hypothetical protein
LANGRRIRSWGPSCLWGYPGQSDVSQLYHLLRCSHTESSPTPYSKNHSKYPLPKLDAVINYVANTYPGVISLYQEFDALVKQILLGETLTTQPTRQMIDDGICRAAVTKLTPQKTEENWQQIDPAPVSQELIKEFISNYA